MPLTDGMKILNSNVQPEPREESRHFFRWVFNFNTMKEIKLSQQGKYKGMYVALVDDEDYEELNKFRWSVSKWGDVFYAIRRSLSESGGPSTTQMHVQIMGCKNIDHVDGDGLNDQRYNMRKCTKQQNNMNMRSNKNTSSIYKGVSWGKRDKRWTAQITINKKCIHIGSFKDEIEAAKAYDKKAVELFGEFARPNFTVLLPITELNIFKPSF